MPGPLRRDGVDQVDLSVRRAGPPERGMFQSDAPRPAVVAPIGAAPLSSAPRVVSTSSPPPLGPPPPPPPPVIRGPRVVTEVQRLTEAFGPDSPRWKNTVAICTAICNENATDIREWLHYYKWLGVDRVILTENNSDKPIEADLKDFIDSGFVLYRTEPQPHAQMMIFDWCFSNYRKDYNWIMFFDADEYLVVREKGKTLKGFLDEFKHEAGVIVHWLQVGSNGLQTRPPSGGMLRHYTMCNPEPRTTTKTIANMYFTKGVATNPHTVRYWDDNSSVDESGVCVPLNHLGMPETKLEPATVNRIAMFHYVTKSAEDFRVKSARGGGGGDSKDQSYFDRVQQLAKDVPICREAAALADLCCPVGA